MELKKTRLYTIIAVVLFVAVFAALLTVATLYDLDISKILTKNALPAGQYFSTSGFGLFFEAVGSAPIYLMATIAGVIGFWWGIRKSKKWLAIALPIVCGVVVFVTLYLFVSDIFSYLGEHMHNKEYMSNGYVTCFSLLLALIMSVLLIFAWKQIKPEINEKLIIWSLVILCTMAIYLIVHFVKSPVGRMRYRSMNYIGSFDNYTPWYVTNGKRNLVPEAHGVKIGDSCKSFPSGHTYSAGMVYTLLCLPDLLEKWNKRWVKALLYTGTIGFTAIVAISRILVGAHFMSDVLIGGTLVFIAMVIFREVFIFRGMHVRYLFCKNIPVPIAETAPAAPVETSEPVASAEEIETEASESVETEENITEE